MPKKQNQKKPTVTEIKEAFAELGAIMKSIKGFRISPEIMGHRDRMAQATAGGELEDAIKEGQAGICRTKGILKAFFRNSVENSVKEGVPVTARFNREIAERDDLNMHEDLIDRLKSYRQRLADAVRSGNDENFAGRVAAYNDMCQALEEADKEQKHRERFGFNPDSFKTGRRAQREERLSQNGEASRAKARQDQIIMQKALADEIAAIF